MVSSRLSNESWSLWAIFLLAMLTAVMSYRLSRGDWNGDEFPSEGVQHPEHIEGVARAFAWRHENAAEYDLDNEKLFVGGFSAGGHLSALLS